MKRGNQIRRRRIDSGSSWISYSDMMASLLLLFVLVLCFSMYQFLSMLDTKTAQLDEQTAQLSAQSAQLDEQSAQLNEQASQLALQQSTLDEQASRLLALQSELDTQQSQLSAAQVQLTEQETQLAGQEALLASQKTELEQAQLALGERETQLAQAQTQLAEQQEAMAIQQQKLDDLVGVRTQIVRDLTSALVANDINASVDPNTGDIMLESAVFFAYGKDELTASGQAFLRKFIPVYLDVLLKEENRAYLGEIIIEGHTDSTGGYLSNLRLSQKRALAVATFCLEMEELTSEQRSLLESLLTVTGKSYSNLVLNEDGTENADASRRVEFKFRLKDTEMIDEIRSILGEDSTGATEEAAE